MANWKTFVAPSTASGTFQADMMILLTDGSVLIHNATVTSTDLSHAKEWLRLTPDLTQPEPYQQGQWSSVITMTNAREYFGSGVLSDGRVFAIGGEYSDDASLGAGQNDTPLGEIFDPLTNLWSQISKPSPAFDFVRGDAVSCVLPDGRVLFGGASTTEPPSTWSKLTALWDPVDDTWMQAGLEFGAVAAPTKGDPPEEEGWTLLPNGTVLAAKVRDAPGAERYVPSLDQWVADAATTPQTLPIGVLDGANVYEIGPTILLPNGKVFAIGGSGQTAIYTPNSDPNQSGTWAAGPSFPNDASASPVTTLLTALDAPACLLPNGKVVCVAGTTTSDGASSPDYFSAMSQANPFLVYDPASSATTLPSLPDQPAVGTSIFTYQCWFLILPTGQMLLSTQGSTLFLYTPDPPAANPPGTPTITGYPPTMVEGHSYTLSGTLFNGLSQAVSYGDDGQMSTNYPIFQITNVATGQTHYLRSYNFSTMGVSVSGTVSADVDVPTGLTTGAWNLVAIANGIPSAPVTVQITGQDCFFIVDRSTFGKGEVDTWVLQNPPLPAVFDPAFFVVVEGYTPATDSASQPSVPSPFSQMQIAVSGPPVLEGGVPATSPQRATFPFKITFMDDSMFTASDQPVTLTATFTFASNHSTVSNTAQIELIPEPNPFIEHGDTTTTPPMPWYLSVDMRVFQVVATPGAALFEATLPTTGTAQAIATGFIQSVITNLNGDVGNARNTFDGMPQDEDAEVLQLLPNDPATGAPVYNFAVARVRYRDIAPAMDVRLFFRMWQAQQTNATYDTTTTYRTQASNPDGQPIPLLGVQGDEIITIPFFAEPRVDTTTALTQQTDSHNVQASIPGTGAEVWTYFGCWLDINQTNDLRFPQRIVSVSPDGPFNVQSPLFPITQLVRSAHQCLLAEVSVGSQVIPAGVDPSTSDRLAQRNLAFAPAPNPGHPASRRVPQTLEIRPTPSGSAPAFPDELMIDWGSTPAGSFAEIYLPATSADAIVSMAAALYTTNLIARVDAHTLRFPAGGITYLPVPEGQGANFVGLLTVDLPGTIRKGETYDIVVRQVTRATGQTPARKEPSAFTWRRTLGVFRLTIPVSTKEALLGREEQLLSVMRWIAEPMPITSRWHATFRRYLDQLAERVSFMGGDPGRVLPSPTGDGRGRPRDEGPCFTGKIEGLVFDHHGDFEAFLLETSHGEKHRFESRAIRVEALVQRAFAERLAVTVITHRHHPRRPESIILLREAPEHHHH